MSTAAPNDPSDLFVPADFWRPFLDDGTLPTRWRNVPYLASVHTLPETARLLKVRRNTHAYAVLARYWLWFSAASRYRGVMLDDWTRF